MRLKRLTLQGFKSFADKTEFLFDEGLTGIIGPNGCGKSNVVDAVKWVLGDQRPTSLRGKEMLDLIFNGAEGRAPMGCSEVLLFLERAPEGEADTRPADMSVGRRLFRSGESEYLLNNQVVRLKDVKEALMDTGLGVGAYSVMEQGKIDAVLSANPDERRSIFDEAAGISRYKLRRKEALRRLDRTEQNLARVGDLRRDKLSRVRSLKIQATKARNWRETAERLMALRVAVSLTDSKQHRQTLDGIEARLAEAEVRVAESELQRDEAREALLSGEGKSRELGARLHDLKDVLASVRGDARSREQSLEGGHHRRSELESLVRRSTENLESMATQEGETRAAVEQLERELVELRSVRDRLDEDLPRLQKEAKESRRAHRAAASERERLSVALLEVLQERTMAKNRVRDEELAIQGLRSRRERLDRMLGEMGSKLTRSRDEGSEERKILWDLEHRRDRVRGRLEIEAQRSESLTEEKRTCLEALHALERERSSLGSQIALLEELEASHTGLDEAARELLQEGKGILGRLVDHLECPLELGAALESALGERVQALVVEDADRARAALANLAETKGGGRLILLDASGADAEERRAEHADLSLLDADGIPLLSFLELKAPVREALEKLLEGVLLVPDLEAGRKILEEDEHLLCVTLDGQVLDGPWLRGGRAEQAAGLVQRRSALEALRKDLEHILARLEETAVGQERVESELRRKLGQRRRLELLSEALLRKFGLIEHSLQARERQEIELEEELDRIRVELRELAGEALSCRARMMTPLMDSLLLDRREKAMEQRQADLHQKVRELDIQAQKSQETLVLLQRKEAGIDAELKGVEEKLGLQVHKLEDLARRQSELLQQCERAENGIRELCANMASWKSQAIDYACQARFLEEQVAELGGEYNALQSAALQRRQRAEKLERELEDARDRRGKALLEEREARFKLQKLDEEILEAYRIELPRLRGEVSGYGLWNLDAIQGPPAPTHVAVIQGPPAPLDFYSAEQQCEKLWLDEEFSVRESEQEARVLGSRLQRMGTVNLDAEAELLAAETESSTLENDCVDLEAARKELMDTIRKINLDSRELFQRTFDEAREHFQEIFRMLFQGGKADMELIESDDPLEAGIEIYAKPPGKELRNIRLLSGGERTLTALAILFAVFKVKPSPFCILDEVDAALDEANVERFLRVLAGFVEDTQFLVVTHHKRTMADCQVLYGITMQRKGISSRMAVSLAEVESGRVDAIIDAPQRGDLARKRRVAGEEIVGFGEANA